MRSQHLIATSLIAVALTGCAARNYRAAPISPTATAAAFEKRSLSSPALREYVQATLGSGAAAQRWDLATLTLAAWHFNPAMEIARARMEEANAAFITAGAWTNPIISGGLGGETSPESPWLASVGIQFPLETAGKRRHRRSRAEALADAGSWNMAATAWQVRSQLRAALVEYYAATRNLELLRNEESVRAEQVKLLEQRLAVGMIPLPEVDVARILHTQSLMALRAAEGRVSQSRAALAAVIGIPLDGLKNAKLDLTAFESVPPIMAFPIAQIRRDAVLNRIDVRQSLAAYAASEAALQLEVAKQYPDIQLGPGYEFAEGSHGFTIGFAVNLPVLNRNQGPIAEAEAVRKQAGAQFLAVQAAGVAASEQALAKYAGALNEIALAQQITQQSLEQQKAIERSFKAGESDRVALNGSQLQVVIAEIAARDATHRAQQALGAFEDSVQRPLMPGDLEPLTPQSQVLRERFNKP